MTFRKISAIVRSGQLEGVEKRLQELCVPGISVTPMKGFGKYANFGRHDWFSREVKIELFVCDEDVDPIVHAILSASNPPTANTTCGYSGLGLMGRERINIRSSDIVIVVGGRSGTLGEFAIAYEEGKLIGVLKGSGGITEGLAELEQLNWNKGSARRRAARSSTKTIPPC